MGVCTLVRLKMARRMTRARSRFSSVIHCFSMGHFAEAFIQTFLFRHLANPFLSSILDEY